MKVYRTVVGLILAGCALACRHEEQPKGLLFTALSPDYTNVDFSNVLHENEDFNIIEYLYFYNGGGVGLGDINNDGLTDIYLVSNQDANHLYLNKGDFKFEDITKQAGVGGAGNWSTGVTMADVNGDGLLDIFVCGVGNYKKFTGRNQLFINNGDLTFSDRTEESGLAFSGFCTHATFFDYDNDGDLDMYLLNHSVHTARSYGDTLLRHQIDSLAGDRLYRNDPLPGGMPRFHNVAKEAGIYSSQIGYGLGVAVSDLNLDGYPDIYVSNDFHENDYLYINQHNGTFKQQIERSIPHTSRFSMGNDAADVNNDGWPDIITLDMLPKDEAVIKTTAGEDAYEIFQFKLSFGYRYQFARNALQLNHGLDDNNDLVFSDIAAFSGVEATDWSWAPLLADFDNDGFSDLFVANGIGRRPNDLDYINFISRDTVQKNFRDDQFVARMPRGEAPNVFFRNNQNLQFTDVTASWIDTAANTSNGAAYADLDNDGDLDLVVNNLGGEALLYRNDIPRGDASHDIEISLEGSGLNRFGIGCRVIAYAGGMKLTREQIPSRGWMSSVDYKLLMGIGKAKSVDSLFVIWPDGNYEALYHIEADHLITLSQVNAHKKWKYSGGETMGHVMKGLGELPFRHRENPFVPFNVERLLPRTVATEGPKMAVGDIDGDGLEDVFVGGAGGQAGAILIQQRSGGFMVRKDPALNGDATSEDAGAAFLDANGDGRLDLVVAGGGQEFEPGSYFLQPRLYLATADGQLRKETHAFSGINVDASCVRPADFDNDGDVDLFIGGRVIAGNYGKDPESFLLVNDGSGRFTPAANPFRDANNKILGSLGMVTDATWTDLDGDGRIDLLVVGEWMPVRVFRQEPAGSFHEITAGMGLGHSNGWWNVISGGDFDGDGDEDFVVGNLGLNGRLRPSESEPVEIFITDIDGNGVEEPVLTYYNHGNRYPFLSKDQLLRQVPPLKRKFLKYDDYKDVRLEGIIPIGEYREMTHKEVFGFASVYLENVNGQRFVIHELPPEAQLFPIYAFCVDDVNGDGHPDVLCGGNLYDVQPELGRFDAGYGLILEGDGAGQFSAVDITNSGFIVRGQVRDIQKVVTANGVRCYIVARNNDSPLIFKADSP